MTLKSTRYPLHAASTEVEHANIAFVFVWARNADLLSTLSQWPGAAGPGASVE